MFAPNVVHAAQMIAFFSGSEHLPSFKWSPWFEWAARWASWRRLFSISTFLSQFHIFESKTRISVLLSATGVQLRAIRIAQCNHRLFFMLRLLARMFTWWLYLFTRQLTFLSWWPQRRSAYGRYVGHAICLRNLLRFTKLHRHDSSRVAFHSHLKYIH